MRRIPQIVFVMCGLALFAAEPLAHPFQTLESAEVSEEKPKTGFLETLKDTVKPYGSLRVRFAMAAGEQEVQNGSSRVGIRVKREFRPKLAVIGRVEWQLNLVEDPTILTVGDSTNAELVATENAETFRTRLGWLGFDFGDLGRLTIGKQWSVYYDVAGWTDQFYVFGATSLGVFNGGTDGGATGTGRAEQAIAWRVDKGRISAGIQYQSKGLSAQRPESYGVVLRWRPMDWLEVGAAFNEADLGDIEGLIRVTDNSKTITAGLKIKRENLHVAFSYADQTQNEVGRENGALTLLDAEGFELYARHDFIEKLGLFGGGNWRDANDDHLDAEADVSHAYLGIDWHFDDRTFAYVQGRAAGKGAADAVVLGLRYGF